MFRLAEMRISQSLSLRKKFLYDLSVLDNVLKAAIFFIGIPYI